jgi:tetratricopeptide (TPR) repeat protein
MERLSDLLDKVYCLYRQGLRHGKIARMLNITPSMVNQAISRIAAHFADEPEFTAVDGSTRTDEEGSDVREKLYSIWDRYEARFLRGDITQLTELYPTPDAVQDYLDRRADEVYVGRVWSHAPLVATYLGLHVADELRQSRPRLTRSPARRKVANRTHAQVLRDVSLAIIEIQPSSIAFDAALRYADELDEYAKKTHDSRLHATANYIRAYAYHDLGQYQRAMYYFKQVEQHSKDPVELIGAKRILALYLTRNNHFTEARRKEQDILRLFYEHNPPNELRALALETMYLNQELRGDREAEDTLKEHSEALRGLATMLSTNGELEVMRHAQIARTIAEVQSAKGNRSDPRVEKMLEEAWRRAYYKGYGKYAQRLLNAIPDGRRPLLPGEPSGPLLITI